jgi:hypothetical protein
MELESLTCNNCGASLQVPHAANFVTCASCGSQLAVKRTESVAYTEVLTRLDKRTTQMETELRRLKLDSELDRIDDDWESERQEYLIRSKDGAASEPTVEGALLQGGLIAGIGGLGTCVVAGMSGTSNPPTGRLVKIVPVARFMRDWLPLAHQGLFILWQKSANGTLSRRERGNAYLLETQEHCSWMTQ